jgi:type VI secretion system protein VasD
MNCLTCLPMLMSLLFAGCAGGGPKSAPPPPREVAIKLHAAARLNSDAKGQPLALVTRIYTLRQQAAFERASFDTFLSAQREKEALGTDLIDVKEVTLVPGQRYDAVERVGPDAAFIGVVGLFHSPSARRWRVAFTVAEAERLGIAIAAQACSLNVVGSSASLMQKASASAPAPCQ